MVALAVGSKPTMTLVVDLQACTYQLESDGRALNALRTEAGREHITLGRSEWRCFHAKGGAGRSPLSSTGCLGWIVRRALANLVRSQPRSGCLHSTRPRG
jgi:hypothetical protein